MRLHFETGTESLGSGSPTTVLWIFAEPVTEDEIERIQSTSKARIAEFEKTMMGKEEDEEEPEDEASVEQASCGFDSSTPSSPEEAGVMRADASSPSSDTSTDPAKYTSSHSSADPDFIKSIASSPVQGRKPLFAASLICKTRINGLPVSRPEPLKPTDNWEVEYLLREWDAPDAMWARYEQMKARRKEMFEKFRDEDGEEGEGENGKTLTSKQKKDKHFIDFLKSMSKSGREFRSKMDEAEEGKKPTIFRSRSRTALVEYPIFGDERDTVEELEEFIHNCSNRIN